MGGWMDVLGSFGNKWIKKLAGNNLFQKHTFCLFSILRFRAEDDFNLTELRRGGNVGKGAASDGMTVENKSQSNCTHASGFVNQEHQTTAYCRTLFSPIQCNNTITAQQ